MYKTPLKFKSLEQKNIFYNTILVSSARIISLVAAIAVFYIANVQAGFSLTSEFAIGFYAILVALFVDRITSAADDFRQRTKEAEEFSLIEERLENSFDLEVLDSEEEAISYLSSRVRAANVVVNSFVGTDEGWFGTQPAQTEILSLYSDFFESGGREWIDVISHNEVNGSRINGLRNIRGSPRYKVLLLRHSMPVLNFTLLDYGGGTREVLFGWTYSSSPLSNEIFRSSDASIINLFQDYYSALRTQKIEEMPFVDTTNSGKNELVSKDYVDRAGFWAVVAFDSTKVKSLSLFQISFSEGEASLTGAVLWNNKYEQDKSKAYSHGIEEIRHEKEKVSYSRKKIFLEYASKVTSRKGICVYNFRKGDKNQDRLSGYLHDEGRPDRLQLSGIKIDPIDTVDWKEIRSIAIDRREVFEQISLQIEKPINWDSFGYDLEK